MAFPTIPTVGAGRVLSTAQANTTATRTFPSLTGLTKNSGDLLIAIAVAYQTSTGTDAAFSSWGGSFTETADRATSTTMAIGVAHKWSTGSETGTFTVTQAGTITGHCQLILLSIPGAHASTAPEVSTKVNGTSGNATPSALNPAGWGTEDTLWIEVIGWGEVSTTGSATGISGVSTNYSDTYTAVLTADAAGGVEAAVAFRQLNAASDQPNTSFSVDTSNARHSVITIAIRPAPAANQGAATGAVDWAGSATGTRTSSGSATGSVAWVGSSTGARTPKGDGIGSVTWAGTADGEAPVVVMDGNATGAISWAGTAAGTTAHRGDATGSVTWAGSAGGFVAHRGASTGAVTWTGSSTGEIEVEGAASGNITWVGSANGAAPSLGPKEGSAAGAITWTGSANGETPPVPMHEGAAVGAVTWVGVATGQQPSQGPWWFPAPVAYARNGGGYQGARPGYVKRIPGYTNGG